MASSVPSDENGALWKSIFLRGLCRNKAFKNTKWMLLLLSGTGPVSVHFMDCYAMGGCAIATALTTLIKK